MRNLFVIIKYESLMLLRTWKFWILAIIGMAFPVIFNIIIIVMRRLGAPVPGWLMLDGSGPYMLFYYYNMFLTVIVIFLTSDFREKDSKVQVHEVMCSRSMTNIEYITGKFFGIIVPIISLTCVVVGILSLVNYLVNDYWAIEHYVFNFFILNLPGLLFITAFIIFISSLLRNTAVVFVLVAIYTFAAVYFSMTHVYSLNKLWMYFDYLGFSLPLFPSDLVGVINVGAIILQRIFYVCLGGFFLGLTIFLFYPRLKQSVFWAYCTVIGSVACLAVSGYIFYGAFQGEMERREIVRAALHGRNVNFDAEAWSITGYSMRYTLFDGPAPIKADANVTVKKTGNSPGNRIPFSLNPGLRVTGVSDENGADLAFEQEALDLIVNLPENMKNNELRTVSLRYEGSIDDRVLFLKRAKNDRGDFTNMMPSTVNHTPALVDRQFSYMLPETYWYPQLYNPYVFTYPEKRPVHFFTGEWSFDLPEDLAAVSQGILASIDSSRAGRKNYTFRSAVPVKKISLCTGQYGFHSMEVAGIKFQFFVSREHDGLFDFFSDINESVQSIFADAVRGIREITGLDYPYPSLTYVEVPLTIQWYQENGLHTDLATQSGVVMVSEDMLVRSFKENFDRKRRSADRIRLDKSDNDIKKEILIELIVDNMFADELFGVGKIQSPVASFWSDRVNFTGNVYPVYNHYFNMFIKDILYREIPFYITNEEQRERFENITSSPREMQMRYGISIDTLYHLIRTIPLSELKPEAENVNYHAVMMYKSGRLNNILRELVTPDVFKSILRKFIDEYSYSDVTINDFRAVSEAVSSRDLDWFFSSWLYGNAFPGYTLTGVEAYRLKGGKKGLQYLVEVRLKNGEPDAGYVKVMLRTRNNNQVIKRSEVKGSQELIFGFLVDDEPRLVEINPIFARNTNNITRSVRVPDEFDRKAPWDGIRELSSGSTGREIIIVDDLDAGFSILTQESRNFLRPPKGEAQWRLEESNNAFGKYNYTYRIKKAGKGQTAAKWEVTIPVSGIFEVEAYIFKGTDREKNRLARDVATEFNYTINHSEGTDEAAVNWDMVPEGWNKLGRYYFESGTTASVILTDKADGNVVADGIRFVPVSDNNTPNRQ